MANLGKKILLNKAVGWMRYCNINKKYLLNKKPYKKINNKANNKFNRNIYLK